MATKSLSRSKSMSLKRSKRSDQNATLPDPAAPLPLHADVKPRLDARKTNPHRDFPHRADSGTASGTEQDPPRPKTANLKSNKDAAPEDPPVRIVVDAAADRGPAPASSAVVKDSAEILRQEDNMPIGMALGSPSHMAPGAWKQFNPPTPSQSEFANQETLAPVARPMTSDGSKKKSVWKSLFGKKEAEKPPQPFYQLQVPPPQRSTKPSSPEKNVGKHSPSPVDPPTANLNKMTEGRKLSKAHRTEKHGKSRSRSKSNVDGKTLDAINAKEPTPAQEHDFPQAQRAATSPLLNIDIPNVEMERYSVMFGTVLKRDRTSNLLQRRQGSKDVLKPLNSESLRVSRLTSMRRSVSLRFRKRGKLTNSGRQRADQSICQQATLERPKEESLRPEAPQRRATSPVSTSPAPPSSGLSLFPRTSPQDSRSNSPAPTPKTSASPLRKPPQRACTDPPTPIKFSTSPILARDANGRKGSDSTGKERPKSPQNSKTKSVKADKGPAEPPAPKEPVPELSPDTSTRGSLDSAQSFETAIVAQGHQSDSGNEYNPLDSHAGGTAWEMIKPSLKTRTALQPGSGTTSVSDSTLSLQSQSPLSSLSGQSIAAAQERVARENEARALERERIRRLEKEYAQPRPKPKRSYSDVQAHIGTIDMTNGKSKYPTDVDIADAGGIKRQPTLKERAEEVQNATRVAIARQVSISRQRAQAETIRATRAERAAERAAERERARANDGAEHAADQEPGSAIPGTAPLASNPVTFADGVATTDNVHIAMPPRSPLRRSKTTSTARPRLETTVRPGTASSHTGTAIASTPTTAPSLTRGASLLVVQRSPTGERLVERRNLTPVLVDIPNRKSAYGQVVDA